MVAHAASTSPTRPEPRAVSSVGDLGLTYQSLDLPLSHRAMHDLTLYTAEPGTTSEDRLKLLASLAATQPQAEPADQPHQAAPSTPTPRSGTSENRPPTS
ncbi:hypothetical protein GCM10017771_93330 [Streptomyces capitiformicae]|uniref:Uncharacterized protein n=1 Tax=Streptomyces capitiformicae TaxID=2014920 RepID=A0A919DRU7_9ACTN|nr:hypothetical protein GCM10017771_93330 [Streptomyces capitiformicae]